MGHRSWMLPIRSHDDVEAIRRWLIEEQDKEVDSVLQFLAVCRRDDGSIWALIDSDGSGCIDDLEECGYPVGWVRLLGEMPEWDGRSSHLGLISAARYSAYLDANEDEFFPLDSVEFAAQFGLSRIFVTADPEKIRGLCSVVESATKKQKLRVLPKVGSSLFAVTEAGAKRFGVQVDRLTASLAEECRRELAPIEVISPAEVPNNVRYGFGGRRDLTAYVWEEGDYREVPMVGGGLSDDEIFKMAQNNATRAFQNRTETVVRPLGFVGGNESSGPRRKSKSWMKHLVQDRMSATLWVSCVAEESDDRPAEVDRFVSIHVNLVARDAEGAGETPEPVVVRDFDTLEKCLKDLEAGVVARVTGSVKKGRQSAQEQPGV